MLTSALLLALAAQPSEPPVDVLVPVVLTSSRSGAESFTRRVAQKVLNALRGAQVGDVIAPDDVVRRVKSARQPDPKTRQGLKKCIARLQPTFGGDSVLVSIDVGKFSSSLAVHLMALAQGEEDVVADSNLLLDVKDWEKQLKGPLDEFAAVVARRTKRSAPAVETTRPAVARVDPPKSEVVSDPPAPPPAVVSKPANDAPLAENKLTPPTNKNGSGGSTSAVDAVAAQVRRPPVVPWVLAGASGAGLIAGGIFGALGLSARAEFNGHITTVGGVRTANLPQQQMDAIANRANTNLTAALISAGVGVAFGVASGIGFARASSSTPPTAER